MAQKTVFFLFFLFNPSRSRSRLILADFVSNPVPQLIDIQPHDYSITIFTFSLSLSSMATTLISLTAPLSNHYQFATSRYQYSSVK